MKFMVVALGLLLTPALAQADELNAKRCILLSAQKLPMIPGLSISASASSAGDAGLAADQITKSALTVGALRSIAETFDFLEGETYRKFESQYADSSDLVSIVRANLKTRIQEAYNVDLTVEAAAQTATFTFNCGIGINGVAYAVPAGISK